MSDQDGTGTKNPLLDLLGAVVRETSEGGVLHGLFQGGPLRGNVHWKNFQTHALRAEEELLRGCLVVVQEAIKQVEAAEESKPAKPAKAAKTAAKTTSKRSGKIEIA